MCTAKCSRCIAVSLYPLVLLSVICNIVLFFPAWSTKFVKEGNVTPEVYYMGGLIGGGALVSSVFSGLAPQVLIPAIYIHFAGKEGCCGNRCGMFLSIAAAAIGVFGAFYSFTVAMFGFSNGPLCRNGDGEWTRPFLQSNSSYVTNYKSWVECTEPSRVVQFNLGLFVMLMATSCLQGALCIVQMINGLAGCLFGTCSKKESA